MLCLSCLQSKIVSWNQQIPEISPSIKPRHVYQVQHPKLCLEINKFLKLVLISSHVMFIRFSIQNYVLKSKKSSNYFLYQATSCLSGLQLKIVSRISKFLKLVLVSSHVMFIMFSIQNCVLKSKKSSNYSLYQAMSCLSGLQSKIVSRNQQISQISAGIKPCHVYHVQHQKLYLEIKKVMKLVLVSSHIMFIRFNIKNCILKSTKSWN